MKAEEDAELQAEEDAKKQAEADAVVKAAVEANKTAEAALKTAQNTKAGGQIKDAKIVKMLDKIGKCSSGNPWIKQSNGDFQCSGGMHNVTAAQLASLG